MEPVWRTDPALQKRFHPDYPDDLQVLVHDGGPRFTILRPEIMWVHVTGKQGIAYAGILLNAPKKLQSVKNNDRLLFLAPVSEKFLPVRVTEQYLAEQGKWQIAPCEKCGFNELFDPPSQLIQKVFNLAKNETLAVFSARCPLCGGTQIVQMTEAENKPHSQTRERRWWHFWKANN